MVVLFCDICMCIGLQAGFWELLLGVVVSVLFVLFMALFGLMLGLKMPNLTWTNEITPIKQGGAVMLALFSGFAYAALGHIHKASGIHLYRDSWKKLRYERKRLTGRYRKILGR